MRKRIILAEGTSFSPSTPPQIRMLRRYGYGNNNDALFPTASQDFTLVARIFLTNNFPYGDTFVIHMSSADSGPNRLLFRFSATGTFARLEIINSASATQLFSSGTLPVNTFPRATWYTLVARRAGTTWTFFLNGAQIATGTQSGTWNPSGEANKYLRFSGREPALPQQFAIKYATLHFRALTNTEITTNYGTSFYPTVPSDNLVGHWVFDNTDGFTIPDARGPGYYPLEPITFPVAAGSARVTPAINTADYWSNLNNQAISCWEGIHSVVGLTSAVAPFQPAAVTLPYTATFIAPCDCYLRRLVLLANAGNNGASASTNYDTWNSSQVSFGHYRINGGSLIAINNDQAAFGGYVSTLINDTQILAGDTIEWIIPAGFASRGGANAFKLEHGLGLGLLLTS